MDEEIEKSCYGPKHSLSAEEVILKVRITVQI